MKEFIKLLVEQVDKDLYTWNLECFDMEVLKNNFNDIKNLGIGVEAVYEDDYKEMCEGSNQKRIVFELYTSINPKKKFIEEIYTTDTLINEKTLNIIEKLVLDVNTRYNLKFKKAEKGKSYYYIDTTFNIIEEKEQYNKHSIELYNSGNYFTNKREAEKYRDKILKIFQDKKI